MPLANRTIRLFVSSTFNDFKAERNALQAQVCQQPKWASERGTEWVGR